MKTMVKSGLVLAAAAALLTGAVVTTAQAHDVKKHGFVCSVHADKDGKKVKVCTKHVKKAAKKADKKAAKKADAAADAAADKTADVAPAETK